MDQITALGTQVQSITTEDQLKSLFTQLKKSLLKEGLLAITASQLNPNDPNYLTTIDKMIKTVETYQYFAIIATKIGSFNIFTQIFTQLTPFYIDFLSILQPKSTNSELFTTTRLTIISVRLLILLSDTSSQSLQQFHCQLEYLTPIERLNPTIRAVLDLEQSFMQGAYSRIIESQATVTLVEKIPGVNVLTQNLKNIVLERVALIVSKSSKRYLISQLKNTYKLNNNDINKMIKDNNWNVIDDIIIFEKEIIKDDDGNSMNDDNNNNIIDNTSITADGITKQQQQLAENKKRANQFVIDIIKIAQESEKIV